MLTAPAPLPDIGYSEGAPRVAYIEDRDAVRALTLRFGILSEQALPPAASVEMITEAVKGYR